MIYKVLESLMKDQLEDYFESEKLIPNEHLGSLKNHSTMTCKISIDSDVAETVDNHKNALVLTTDLSVCFDLVDHKLLLEKLEHMGVEKDAIELMGSFLSDRSFIVDVQGFTTEKFKQPPCSIIQGSCFSGFLMTCSALETPLLPKLMNHPNVTSKVANKPISKHTNIAHSSHSYVDDNSNVIGASSIEKPYL